MARPKRGAISDADPATKSYIEGLSILQHHPLFDSLLNGVVVVRSSASMCPPRGWALTTTEDRIHVHPSRRAEPAEWAWVIAHSLLHLAFGHIESPTTDPPLANARCVVVNRFLMSLKVGRPPTHSPSYRPATKRRSPRRYAEETSTSSSDSFRPREASMSSVPHRRARRDTRPGRGALPAVSAEP